MNPQQRIAAICCAVCIHMPLLSGRAAALEIDTQAFQHHPVRMTVGLVSLALALILIIYALTRAAVRRAKRDKSYGEGGKMRGISVPSYKKKRGNDKQYGSRFLGRMLPNYKGGKSSAESANLKGSLPLSYKESWGSRKRYGKFHFGAFLPFYKGGKSAAGEARVPKHHQPRSYETRRGRRSLGGMRFPLPLPSYKGGKSSASAADLRGTLPNSYKESRGSAKRYGSYRYGSAVSRYKGGKSAAGEGRVPIPHRPGSFGGVRRYKGPDSTWRPNLPTPSYKGGASAARGARLYTTMPTSYRKGKGAAGEAVIPVPHTPSSHGGRRSDPKGMTGWRPDLPTPSYKGGASAARAAKLYTTTPASYRKGRGAAGEAVVPVPHTPSSHSGRRLNPRPFSSTHRRAPATRDKGGWPAARANKSGGSAALSAKLYSTAPVSYRMGRGAAGEAAVPVPHTPSSHSGRRFNTRQLAGWQPDLPLPSYKGGVFAQGPGEVPTTHQPARHTGFRLSNLRFGAWRLDAPIPSYKGSFAPAKAAGLTRQAPQTHRRRFNGQRLTGKTWCIPVDSYKGGYGVAGVGKPLQALPPSYKAPWGSQRCYTGVMLAVPIRMDGSPMPSRTAMELPMSYKEPWGGSRRYTGVRFRLPIRMDGSQTQQDRAVLELNKS
ncbi:MAG: hypothetical protein LUD78_12590 [Clostridiales bacterium]|nr:hypothetical protein [Clostridiales bacterium]